ncbi:G protein-coupled receptor GPR1 [Candida viswanathii]|uniref:G protein-coupled receptor GPR1 n=1 Tax=Candida viswanathii TaxID=5486 RepID=A0A367YGT5_9ASCO|nr:G protein-coupled receptor GPR1 [Candida viswanathii]
MRDTGRLQSSLLPLIHGIVSTTTQVLVSTAPYISPLLSSPSASLSPSSTINIPTRTTPLTTLLTITTTTAPSIIKHILTDSVLSTLIKRVEEAVVDPAINQLLKFTNQQAFVQRVVAIASSCGSIAAVLIAMYFLFAIDPKRTVFRHQLIFFLLFFDLLKACILLLYPTRVLAHSSAYYNHNFCQIVGFFTATAIEGADIAIFAFAIHTFLLIFKPSLNSKVKNTNRVEGGLYKFRFYVYSLSFFVPLIIASLAFINSPGYESLVCWCYLPMRPVWARLVLSWVPRYCIVVAIFVIYGLIYIHVISEFKTLGGVFSSVGSSHHSQQQHHEPENPTFFSSLKYFFQSVRNSLFPDMRVCQNDLRPSGLNRTQNQQGLVHPQQGQRRAVDSDRSTDEDDDDDDSEELAEALEPESVDYQDVENQKEQGVMYNNEEIQQANLESFRRRQRIIQKQMKSIFIYPFAYCFVWLFPFILQATQFNYELKHHPVYWLNVLGAFMQPFNGFVDAAVFFYRERPWKNTTMRTFEKEHRLRVDTIIMNNLQHRKYSEGGESTCTMAATSARIAKNSLSASSGLVDIEQYSRWRRYLNDWNFPFYELPTQKNIAKFQEKYIEKKLSKSPRALEEAANNQLEVSIPKDLTEKYRTSSADENNPFGTSAGTSYDAAGLLGVHDFSNILNDAGGTAPLEPRDVPGLKPNFGKFGFSRRSSTIVAGPSRRSSAVMGFGRSRPSIIESPDPVALKSMSGRRSSSFAAGTNSTLSTPHRLVHSPTSSTFSPIGDKDDLSPIGDEIIEDEDAELDFLEFLKKGPPA